MDTDQIISKLSPSEQVCKAEMEVFMFVRLLLQQTSN